MSEVTKSAQNKFISEVKKDHFLDNVYSRKKIGLPP